MLAVLSIYRQINHSVCLALCVCCFRSLVLVVCRQTALTPNTGNSKIQAHHQSESPAVFFLILFLGQRAEGFRHQHVHVLFRCLGEY